MKIYIFLLLILLVSFFSCTKEEQCQGSITSKISNSKYKGMTVFASDYPIDGNPVDDLKALNVNSIAITPYRYYSKTIASFDSLVFDSLCSMAGCGMKHNATQANIELIVSAQAKGMKVMLKPQIWAKDAWVGELGYDTEAKWLAFEKNYTNYIMKWANIAAVYQVDLFCIGTELKISLQQRTQYWDTLIDSIKSIYNGKITYASNWDDTHLVPFWDRMDYIGIDAYFPLSYEKTPTVCDLKNRWLSYVSQIQNYNQQYNKPILFTEFGYLSVDSAAAKTWELEIDKNNSTKNEEAQANATSALLQTFGDRHWWAGGFQWKWYADSISGSCDGDLTKDYTPKNKECEAVLSAIY